MHFSDYEYYVRHDGSTDELAALLNCFQAGMYFALKRKMRIESPYELFVTDPAIATEIDHDGVFRDIRTLRTWNCFEVFKTRDFEGVGQEALARVEELLDQGEIVLFTTHNGRVPFFEGYESPDAPYDPAIHITPQNHMFLAIGHDEKRLYYAESPHLLTPHHVQHGDFAGVGAIDKSAMAPAFQCFLHYRYPEVNDGVLTDDFLYRRLRKVLSDMVSSEGKASSKEETYDRYCGDEAYDALIRCSREGGLRAGSKTPPHVTLHQAEVLLWKFRNLKQQKGLLYQALVRRADRFGPYAQTLLEAAVGNFQRIEMLVNKLRIMQFRNKFTDDGLIELLEGIRDSEIVWGHRIRETLAATPTD